jgi:heptosyltransferase I
MELPVISSRVSEGQRAEACQGPEYSSSLRTLRTRLENIKPKRIAIIKPSALGDIAHALPIATALRYRFPHAELSWIVNKSYASLLEQHPDLDDVIVYDRQRMKQDWFAGLDYTARFLRHLRKRHFDLVIDLQGLFRSAMMVQASGAQWKLGLASAREGARYFYNAVLPDDLWNMHAVDRYWLAMDALGYTGPKQSKFPNLDAERNRWLAKLAAMPRPWVMMNLGTRWETKRWPVKHFAILGQHAHLTSGGSTILVGGPEEAVWAGEFVRHWDKHVASMVGQTGLRDLVALLSLADVVVSNDSGPLHLAVALGKSVLSPFTCTSSIRTGPYGQPGGAVATSVPCAASYVKTCSHMSCTQELTPERLLPALDGLLRTWQRYSA